MREMKDSGVEWIGEIPKDWKVCKIKNIAQIYTGNSIRDEEKGRYENSDNARPYIATKDIDVTLGTTNYENGLYIKKNDLSFKVAYKGSTLMCIEGGSAGKKKTYLLHNVSFGNKLCCFYSEIINKTYLYFFLSSPNFEMEFANCISGLIGGVSVSIIKNMAFLIPSKENQQCIANMLKDKCSKIDAIITREQAVIEKLKEYKLSVITEAVTKGLDPDVPMKDSGVEWIGEIPQYWDISHIGNLAEIGSGGTPDRKKSEYWENGSIRWMASGEINYEFVYDTAEKITEQGLQNSNAKLLPINTVMLGLIGQGKTKGLTAILKNECTCNQNLAYLIPYNYLLYYEYLFYCFKGMYIFIRGIVGDSQAGIYQNFLKKQYIPLPTIDEQKEICKILNSKCSKIDASMKKKELLITKLTEYKKSLIYEAVTGKKEV